MAVAILSDDEVIQKLKLVHQLSSDALREFRSANYELKKLIGDVRSCVGYNGGYQAAMQAVVDGRLDLSSSLGEMLTRLDVLVGTDLLGCISAVPLHQYRWKVRWPYVLDHFEWADDGGNVSVTAKSVTDASQNVGFDNYLAAGDILLAYKTRAFEAVAGYDRSYLGFRLIVSAVTWGKITFTTAWDAAISGDDDRELELYKIYDT